MRAASRPGVEVVDDDEVVVALTVVVASGVDDDDPQPAAMMQTATARVADAFRMGPSSRIRRRHSTGRYTHRSERFDIEDNVRQHAFPVAC